MGLLPHSQIGSAESFLPNDKVLHYVSFFILSVVFYWIIDTSRRRVIHITAIICMGVLGVGSEFLQSMLPNGRQFDLFDILANALGCASAMGLCAWYHKRMLERKRKIRFGSAASGQDVELGLTSEGQPLAPQESGVAQSRSLDEELDNWEENEIDDWDEEEDGAPGPAVSSDEHLESKPESKLRND